MLKNGVTQIHISNLPLYHVVQISFVTETPAGQPVREVYLRVKELN